MAASGYSVDRQRRPGRAAREPPSSGCPSVPRSRPSPPQGRSPPRLHAAAARAAHRRGQLLRRRRPRPSARSKAGRRVPVTYGGTPLKADGTHDRQAARRPDRPARPRPPRPAVAERRLAGGGPRRRPPRAEPGLRPLRRRLRPDQQDHLRRDQPTARVIRRMPNLVKFREDPDAMLVMALEDYDEVTGKAAKAAIMQKDVVGKSPPITARRLRRGRAAGLARPHAAAVDLPFIATLYGKPEDSDHRRAGRPDLPRPGDARPGRPPTTISRATCGRSSPPPRRAGPDYARNAEALRAVQPEDVLPGDIDANLGAPWIPESDIQAFAAELFGVAAVGHPGRPPEEGRGLERRRRTTPPSSRSPPPPSTARRGPTAPGCSSWRST